MGGGVNENRESAGRPHKVTARINTYCWRAVMLVGMGSLWIAYLFIVQRKLSDMCLGLIQGQKEYGGYQKRKLFVLSVFLLLVWESEEEKVEHS